MKRSGFFLPLLALLGALFTSHIPSQAQTVGGLLLDRDIVTPADMFELSQTTFTFGTARSMAMAGAFTSLGADLSSLAINPAGLGMYRRNDISITPMMGFERSVNSAEAFEKNAANRFALGNFGFAAMVYQGTGRLLGLTFGFGYNRLQDLNYTYSYQSQGNVGSIADVFSDMLGWGGIGRDEITGDLNWGRINPQFWAPVLGYKTGLTDQVNGTWSPTWIGNGADIGHYTTVESRGSVGEYALSLGGNIDNKFYFGFSLGIQNVYQRKIFSYGEDYIYGNAGSGLDYQLLYAHFNQEVVVDGVGVNFKAGFTYRPIESLRIGVAIHTPTRYVLDRKYQAYADSRVQVNGSSDEGVMPGPDGTTYAEALSPALADTGEYNWTFISPARLLVGASYTFGERAILSVDYERDWYNGVRIRNNPGRIADAAYNETFREGFRGVDIVRVGVEFKPVPRMALRAGFGYMGSAMKDPDQIASSPMTRRMLYGSAGLGFTLSRTVVLDLAYSYTQREGTDYDLFYSAEGPRVNESAIYNTRLDRHSAALTLSFRF